MIVLTLQRRKLRHTHKKQKAELGGTLRAVVWFHSPAASPPGRTLAVSSSPEGVGPELGRQQPEDTPGAGDHPALGTGTGKRRAAIYHHTVEHPHRMDTVDVNNLETDNRKLQ